MELFLVLCRRKTIGGFFSQTNGSGFYLFTASHSLILRKPSLFRIHHMILKSAIEWVHVCVEIDSIQNVVKVSVNGGNISTLTGVLTPRETRQLSMFIGIPPPDIRSSYPRQFTGLVSNINIYLHNSQLDIQEISADPCLHATSGDFLAWEGTDWIKHGDGDHLLEVDMEAADVCNENPVIRMALPLEMSWLDANETCHMLSTSGTLADIRTNQDVHKMVESTSQSCDYMWTPYVRAEQGDTYLSSNDGQEIGNLTWFGNEPSGEKFVAVYLSFGIPSLLTATDTEEFCVACKIPKGSIFTLWGVCKYSLLGSRVSRN